MAQDQVSGLRQAVTGQRRADLDALAHRLRAEGLAYQAIAERLRVDVSMARRRVTLRVVIFPRFRGRG